jgi:amidase
VTRFVDPLLSRTGVRETDDGPLAGLTVAVKDVIDLEGVRTGAGNPEYRDDARPATAHAAALQRLLDAGASVIGKAISDEFAYSLAGTNSHYGTPHNPAAPGRVPGGSSSGSASAVALGLADLGLGTDTGGSVRVPASYCGLYGLRPTHGRVPLTGIMPLAASFDTCGLLAADGELLERGGRVLLGAGAKPAAPPSQLVLASELLAVADPAVAEAVRGAAPSLAAALGCTLSERVVFGEKAVRWPEAFAELQRIEAWTAHGPWLVAKRPRIGAGVAARLAAGEAAVAAGPAHAAAAAEAVRAARVEVLAALASLPDGAVVVLPSAPTVAPEADQAGEQAIRHRARVFVLTCPAGLAGAPQVSLPLCDVGGRPAGVGLLGRPDEDERLLAAAARCARA